MTAPTTSATTVRIHKAQYWRVLAFVGDPEIRVRGHRLYRNRRHHWTWRCDVHGRTRNCSHVTDIRGYLKGIF